MFPDRSPTAEEERAVAREVYECAVLLAIHVGDRESFQRYLANLRPYYSGYRYWITMHGISTYLFLHFPRSEMVSESRNKYAILGLQLLYYLVENRLEDFHSELELLSNKQRKLLAIQFCTALEQHLMIGSYDRVMEAAAHPPVEYYAFFLTSLLETVRMNVAECVAAAYHTITLDALTKVLMFQHQQVRGNGVFFLL